MTPKEFEEKLKSLVEEFVNEDGTRSFFSITGTDELFGASYKGKMADMIYALSNTMGRDKEVLLIVFTALKWLEHNDNEELKKLEKGWDKFKTIEDYGED